MAKPTTNVNRLEPTTEEQLADASREVQKAFAEHGDAIKSLLAVVQDLYDSGVLEMMHALLNSKEKVASIALEQILKPSVLNTIKNAMTACSMVSKIDPEQLSTLVDALVVGLRRGQDNVESGKRVGVLQLAKTLRNSDVNRTFALLLGVLEGMGQKL
ncbi:DUF1641 domain-containing protein [Alicyclobacillus fastidiosus]|uniref:DUF1641 domain-containing protein n=1 Tax=Alicyclobacillus fastidiosus TaxID=392011 RepID=A0ABV5AGC8_9BACL|nr:DUF1641 domain-containing protein [Alicyclobacillus fastidiosus]WEH08929.1 DUF1641 domain-containing protein [Alicyclobacillus fastidiosus]